MGLDSGFEHYNQLCNGLDTGLTVLAAPPGRGKTSLLWQIACQAAQLNRVRGPSACELWVVGNAGLVATTLP